MQRTPQLRTLLAVAALALAGVAAAPAMASAAPPEVLMPNIQLLETDAGSTPTLVNVALDRPNPYPVPVSVLVYDLTGQQPPVTQGAATPGVDYVPFAAFRLKWYPGQQIATFPVTLLGDTVVEGDEDIRIIIGSPLGVTIRDNDANFIIGENDPSVTTGPFDLPLISLPNVHIREADSGCAPYQVSLLLSRPARKAASVIVIDTTMVPNIGSNPPTFYGSATPGSDYMTFAPITLKFRRGQSAATFPVTICGDTQHEEDEEIDIRVVGPSELSILDNDLNLILDNGDD